MLGDAAVEDPEGGRLPRQDQAGLLHQGRFKVAAGKTKKVAVHLGSEKADLIRDEPKARRVLATANVADAAGNHGVVKRNLRLAPAKRR